MKTTRRTEIVFEHERTIVYAGRYPHRAGWCEKCAADVQMITVFEAARLMSVATYTIYALGDAGSIHATTTHERVRLVCLDSLLSWFNVANP